MTSPPDFTENIRRFTGFAGLYDRYRPAPPDMLAPLLAQHAGNSIPSLVVDLGCGTGLSSRYWADKSERVVGIEPTPDMRLHAEAMTQAKNVSYLAGYSHATGLPVRSADIVCCMQALHWMEPAGTFAEAARLLKPGGIFAACDYDWPPVTSAWPADAAFKSCIRTARRFEKTFRSGSKLQQWDKASHFQRMESSNCFRYVKEALVHHLDEGNAERLVGLLLSQGFVQTVLNKGVGEAELGIDVLRRTAIQTLGDSLRPFLWSARVQIGVV